MKLEKVYKGWYATTNGKYEIMNKYGTWMIYKRIPGKQVKELVCSKTTLKKAKEYLETVERGES